MGSKDLSQPQLTPTEAQLLEESMKSKPKTVNIRLRKGEYQYDLAKGIASFQLALNLPDVKDLTEKLYGEERAGENQFIRKIQTILKKMEKSDIVKILPKKKPWELQRYALSSFKFEDVDKNLTRLATPKQIKQAKKMLHSALNQQSTPIAQPSYINIKILMSALTISTSYTAVLWSLLQPSINPIIYVPAFCITVTCSILLGKLLSQK